MLKLATDPAERLGGRLMAWWAGDGAAPVLARAADALLLLRAEGPGSLTAMAHAGRDAEATGILCEVAARLHARRGPPPRGLKPLASWFAALAPAAAAHGGALAAAAEAARRLLAEPRDRVALHGDLHHDNVLDFGARGWLAIDPKGLIGERGFDYANIFTNPDLGHPARPLAVRPDRFAERLGIVAVRAGLERARLLDWIVAWTGLSAAWFIADGESPAIDLAVAELALAERAR